MPAAERLLVDPELLRQREGSQVNQSLLTFAGTLRKLAQGSPLQAVNQDASLLTKLLSGLTPSCGCWVLGQTRLWGEL